MSEEEDIFESHLHGIVQELRFKLPDDLSKWSYEDEIMEYLSYELEQVQFNEDEFKWWRKGYIKGEENGNRTR